MTDLEDIKKDVTELRDDFREVISVLSDLKTARAVSDVVQKNMSDKMDMLQLTLSNNYVSAVEFGATKLSTEDRIRKLENWQTWALRGIVGAAVSALIAYAGFKGHL